MTGQAGLYSMEKHDNRGAARANLLVAASHDFLASCANHTSHAPKLLNYEVSTAPSCSSCLEARLHGHHCRLRSIGSIHFSSEISEVCMKIIKLAHGSDSKIDDVSGKFDGRASLLHFSFEKNGGNLRAHL